MAERHLVEVSQNGWEYTGHVVIECQGGIVKDDNDSRVVYAGNVMIKFDEEVGEIVKISD